MGFAEDKTFLLSVSVPLAKRVVMVLLAYASTSAALRDDSWWNSSSVTP